MRRFELNRILVLLIAAAWDLVIGDPKNVTHPVQIIGKLIDALEAMLRKLFHIRDAAEADRARKRCAGLILTILVAAISTLFAYFVTGLFYRIHPVVGVILEGILCGQMLAMKSLKDAAESVRIPLAEGDTEGARHAVSMIVGRDTKPLDEAGITRAAVETVAENTSDGIIAPLIFEILFGAPGAYFYKSVNTMDSMIGYKNDRYQYFGTAAAKLDDIVNYLPSRIAAVLMICAAGVIGSRENKESEHRTSNAKVTEEVGTSNGKNRTGSAGSDVTGEGAKNTSGWTIPDAANAARIWRRDRRKHPSPNSAQTESVCAGALHLALAGPMYYFGVLHEKPWIGDPDRAIGPEDIRRSERLMEGCAMLTFIAGLILLAVLAAVFTGR